MDDAMLTPKGLTKRDESARPSALYQIGAGYAALWTLTDLKQRSFFEADRSLVTGRPISVVVDAARANEDTILFQVRRAFGDLPLGRTVLTRRRPCTALEIVLGEEATSLVTAPDLGGALFKACAPLADDELVFVFTNALAEAKRQLRALGGNVIDALDEKPLSERRPSLADPRAHIAFAG
jgi:hypothetical protein